jgi:anaerobic dimethyl sulfoxide reductase subunit B (iron-sulfur subunit)
VTVCASGAISKRVEDGIVIIDRKKCVRLGLCLIACPYGAPQVADDTQEETITDWQVAHPAQKCTFCLDRWKKNEQPICVTACPQRALDAGEKHYITTKYPWAVPATEADGFPSDIVNSRNTGPNLYIKKRI